MRSFDDYINEKIAADPSFAVLLDEGEAELRLAMALSARREALGLTQQQLADITGIRRAMLKSYEQAGRTPKLTTLWKLAQALGIEIRIQPGLRFEIVETERAPAPEAGNTAEPNGTDRAANHAATNETAAPAVRTRRPRTEQRA